MTITNEPLITVLDDHGFGADAARLIAAAQTVLTMQAISGSSLTIVLTTDEAVADLNCQFRGVEAPTDILSFPFDDLLSGDADGRYLGDLVIAHPYAAAQAAREGHDLADSLVLLVIHGTLHLIGFDHDTPEARAEMWAVQDAALIAQGVSLAIVPALEDDDTDFDTTMDEDMTDGASPN